MDTLKLPASPDELPEGSKLLDVDGTAVALLPGKRVAVAFDPAPRKFSVASACWNGTPGTREEFDAMIEESRASAAARAAA